MDDQTPNPHPTPVVPTEIPSAVGSGTSWNAGLWLGLAVFEDSPSVRLFDASASSRAVLGVTTLTSKTVGGSEVTPESSLTLFDKDGNVIRSLP